MWFAQRTWGLGAAYHMPLAVHLDGAVDVPALRAAVAAVLVRHPVLGRAVVERDGEPYLVPAPVPPSLAEADGDPDDVLRAESLRPFDLAAGPLARFTLVRRPGGVSLIVVAHHVVFDGTSKDVLVHDLAAAYRGALDTESLPLAAGPDDRAASELSAAREFWAGHRHGRTEPVLPGLRPGVDDPAAGTVAVGLPGGLPDAAAALGVTTFELLLAGWFALLHRYGDGAPVVGVDLGTRTGATRSAVGPFVNELPVGVGRHATFRETAAATRARLRATYPFRAVPLGRAVPGLAPRPSVAPTSVSYRKRAGDPVFDGLASTVDWALPPHAVRALVHLQVVDGPGGPVARLHYRTARFGAAEATRIAADLAALLAEVHGRPDAPLGGTGTAGALRGPVRPVPDVTVPDLVAARAAKAPDAVAVVGPDGTRLSYAELDAWAGRIAAGLRGAGVAPGALVALSLRRGPALVAAVLGAWRAGAAYVPLDPEHPLERRSFVVRDSGAVLVVTEGEDGGEDGDGPGAGDRVPVWHVEDAWSQAPEPASRATPDGLAYVIHTSGSTGRPKGVAVPHRALVNVVGAVGDVVGSSAEDRWLALTPLSFDIAGLELFLPLVNGGRVVLAGDGAGRDGAAVAAQVAREGVTHVQATPTGWRLLLAADVRWPGVTALTGGETLTPALARELRPRLGRLVNMYGPTETTIWSTCWEVPAGPPADEPSTDEGSPAEPSTEERSAAEPAATAPFTVPIGRPLANTTVSVHAEDGSPVPEGVVGELWIGGLGLATGYLGDDDLTARRFPTGQGGRRYRTGDLVRLRDGELEFVGRTDTQVKVRGHRVELGEVEARLAELPDVRAAAVVLRGDVLVGYVEGTADPADLRGQLARTLPAPMLPARFVAVSEWPTTPNGKLDRDALPEPPPLHPAADTPAPSAGTSAGTSTDTPGDPEDGAGTTLTRIGDIWCEVLRVEAVGPDDDLFDLGGHSLVIAQIAARIRDRLGVDVPLDHFYDAPTLAEIAAVVEKLGGSAAC
ncbi:amino acid adenylation domain-containing protein [Actinacidiphila yanglinensis]|uniref:Amino acid adenylation domain-containing protein n=2 Tax=Actinacidiphila yanglinensis TaxID=310779 RepID=A0A1H6D890_9ACTN|nr:amino acid adenylation domain-containing protein [Actinacidiphila yanglinensis]